MGGQETVCLGVVTGAHGVHGRVRIKSFTIDPVAIGGYGPLIDGAGGRVFTLRVTGQTRGQVIAEIDGVRGRDAAEALKGTQLCVARTALPPTEEDEFYHADLIGLAVEVAGVGGVGRVVAIEDFGAGTVLDVEYGGRRTLVPFSRDAVPTVDLAAGRLVIAPLPGLFGDAAAEPDDGHDEAPEDEPDVASGAAADDRSGSGGGA